MTMTGRGAGTISAWFTSDPRGIALLLAFTLAANAIAQERAPIRTRTFTYKTVGDLQIKADLHRADDEVLRPLVVWIHGGGLINGHRAGITPRIKTMMLDAGYAIVSIDYRLAPETKLSAIIEDVEDAFRWLRQSGRELLGVDPDRIAVMGGSAGGFLTLTTGFRVDPRPTVLVAFWGYGDLVGDWAAGPSPHERHRRIEMTPEQAWKEVSGIPVSDSRDRPGDGGAFYQFCRRTGAWSSALTGWDPRAEPGRFAPYLPQRNVDPDFPPTLLIHGKQDTDVPHEQSVLMAKQFDRHGVDYQLISIAGGEHGLGGGDPKLIDAAYTAALEFVDRHMKR